jgi:5-methylcytosine-specific restriction endonuclease McrA
MERTHSLTSFSDDELLRRLSDLLRQSRRCEADLVGHIGEVDSRRLYAREASPSMFAYCTEVLHLSEAEAYLRIAAARASREHPVLLEMLADGRVHLTAIAKLAPHLTPENREALLKRATYKSKREIEELVAELVPRPDAPALMRKLPGRRVATPPASSTALGPDGVTVLAPPTRPGLDGVAAAPELRPDRVAMRLDAAEGTGLQLRPDGVAVPPGPGNAKPAAVEPLAPARYKVQFTASAALHDKLERLRALMRFSVPDGDLAVIIEEAVTEKLERLESRRFGQTKTPRKALPVRNTSATRHIPAAVRRAVYERDSGRCRYEDEQGRRCTARGGLEFHHRYPLGHGGDHSVENLSLACRAHNGYLAEVDYGRDVMARRRRLRERPLEPTPLLSP